jgi:hypothetical protein
MTDNKLYTVLTYFDKIEQNRLRKYVRSPYFNVNETLMNLYDIIITHINESEGKPEKKNRSKLDTSHLLTKEKIWKKLYKTEPYQDTRFRKLGSELLRLVEGFLAQEIYEKKPLQQINYLFEAIGQKKIEKLYSSTESNARLISAQQLQKPADFYYYQYLIEKNYYESLDVDMQRGEKSNVDKIINYLDEFFLAEKIKWYVSILSRKSLVAHEYHLLFIDEIIEYLRRNSYEHNPVITVYYQLLLTRIESENESHYHKLKEILLKYETQFSLNELYELYSGALNFCIRKSNEGNTNFMLELHNLYKIMLDKNIAFHASKNNELSPWDFKNAIQGALRLGNYEWTEDFIKNYQSKLPNEFRENAVSYNLGLVYFYQKKFDKVKEQLREVEYEDIAYNLGSKSMLLAIYYEQDEDDALLSLMDTFKAYLYRHKDIADNKKVPYLNLMKYIRKMLKLNHGDKREIEVIRKEIEEDRKVGIASEKWLLEKLAELE